MSKIPARTLGRSGLQVSQVGLGTNNFGVRLDLEGSRKVIDRALESGITLFDTADIYGGRGGSESILGEVLGARRRQIVLATKFGMPMDDEGLLKGASRHYIVQAVEASLRRLRTDWIDLYQLHRPDPLTPIEETLRALQDLLRDGKVRYIGASNLGGWQVAQAQHLAREIGSERFISSQDHYNLLTREAERDLIPALRAYGVGLLPYFPLESGLLTGKYRHGEAGPAGARLSQGDARSTRFLQPAKVQRAAALQDWARTRGHSLLELAVAWLLAQPVVSSVIAGATSPEQVDANIAAGAAWQLSADELAEIDALLGSAQVE